MGVQCAAAALAKPSISNGSRETNDKSWIYANDMRNMDYGERSSNFS